jgi:hypothetical protein
VSEAAVRVTWITPFYDLWMERVGMVDGARMSKTLAPLLKLHSEETLLEALRNYLNDDTRRIYRIEYFAQDLVKYLPKRNIRLVDEFGSLTPQGLTLYLSSR